jgi:transcriptional pleiotropic regulator of transition state genes
LLFDKGYDIINPRKISKKAGFKRMKATGFIKKIDDLGRIVIPKDIRKTLGVNNGDALQFFVEGDTVVLRKFGEECEFCGETEELTELRGKFICKSCKAALL